MDESLLAKDIRRVSVVPMEIEQRHENRSSTVTANAYTILPNFDEVIPLGIIVGSHRAGKTTGQLNAELESSRISEEVRRGKYDGLSLAQVETEARWRAEIDASRKARSVENSLMASNAYDNPNESVTQTYQVPLFEEQVPRNVKKENPLLESQNPSGYNVTPYAVTEYNCTEYKSIYGDA